MSRKASLLALAAIEREISWRADSAEQFTQEYSRATIASVTMAADMRATILEQMAQEEA